MRNSQRRHHGGIMAVFRAPGPRASHHSFLGQSASKFNAVILSRVQRRVRFWMHSGTMPVTPMTGLPLVIDLPSVTRVRFRQSPWCRALIGVHRTHTCSLLRHAAENNRVPQAAQQAARLSLLGSPMQGDLSWWHTYHALGAYSCCWRDFLYGKKVHARGICSASSACGVIGAGSVATR